MKRRSFLSISLFSTLLARPTIGLIAQNPTGVKSTGTLNTESITLLSVIVNAAQMGQWTSLPIGERMIKVAQYFVDVPYVGGTLEGEPEACRINLAGMDCVTFFENTLDIARMLAHGGSTIDDLRKELTFTRYRNGTLNGYESRLHYTADWIANNIEKKVVADVTPQLGGVPLKVNVSFMSTHPQYYRPLQEQPALIETMGAIETAVNKIPRSYIPRNGIREIENKLQSGDIIAITTSKDGLDYAHTGLINVVNGEARFMHASSSQKKVVLDRTISEYVNSVTSHTGITVVRPI